MPKTNRLAGAVLACMIGLGFHVPGGAQQTNNTVGAASEVEIRERNTNKALLDALLARRAEIARSGSVAPSHCATLDHLDKRIAELRNRIAQ